LWPQVQEPQQGALRSFGQPPHVEPWRQLFIFSSQQQSTHGFLAAVGAGGQA
jgi:hypothetical protein